MSPSQARVELTIDVFEETGQRALALSELKPPQLVNAILQEFHNLEYLGDDADAYYLLRSGSGEPLDAATSLDQQVKQGDWLVLAEQEQPLPGGTRRPSLAIYLREPHEAKAYAVQWLPAIIGRRSEHQPHDELVAVDLRTYETGLRVSRRHLRLTETHGDFYIENLSGNPVSLVSQRRPGPVAVTAARQILAPGDVIRLDRSGIELKFIVRSTAPAPAPDCAEPAPADAEAPLGPEPAEQLTDPGSD
jgi:hypothetical protein